MVALQTKKLAHVCTKCKSAFDERIQRGYFVRKFLFWLPLKRYICYKCKRSKYFFE